LRYRGKSAFIENVTLYGALPPLQISYFRVLAGLTDLRGGGRFKRLQVIRAVVMFHLDATE